MLKRLKKVNVYIGMFILLELLTIALLYNNADEEKNRYFSKQTGPRQVAYNTIFTPHFQVAQTIFSDAKDATVREYTREFYMPLAGVILFLLVILIFVFRVNRSKKAMEASQRYAQSIIDSSLDMIISVDMERRIVEFNKAAQETFGYRKEEVLGKQVDMLYADTQESISVTGEVIEHGYCVCEVMNTRKNGEIFQSVLSASILLDVQANPVGLMGISRDITDRKRAEDQLRQLNQQWHESSRHKSEFLASMSHELRTPLNAMIGYTSLTLNALKETLPSEHLQNLIKAEQSARILLQLINDVLDFSKIEAGRMETFIEEIDPLDLLEDVVLAAEGLLRDKPVELHTDIPEDLPLVESDYTKVKQILNNLTSNAIKFTSAGYVTVRAKVLREKERIHVEIEDTGCGIAEENIDHIFESFRQVDGSIKKKFGGTGLGLAITTRLCEMLNIEIGVHTELNKGTLFWIDIPIRFSASEAMPETLSSSEDLPDKHEETPSLVAPSSALDIKVDVKALILCISMPAIGTSLSRHFAGLPLEVAEPDSVSEAIGISNSSPVWAILVPLSGSGFEAFIQFKHEISTRDIPIIICSPEDTHQGVYIGPVEWLTQPAHVINLLQRSSVRSPGDLLVLEADTCAAESYKQILTEAGYTPHIVKNSREASQRLQEIRLLQAIILDVTMPDLEGFSMLKEIQTHTAWRRTPVVFATRESLSEEEQEHVQAGIQLLHEHGSQPAPEGSSWLEFVSHSVALIGTRAILVVDDNEMNLNLMSIVLEDAKHQVYKAQSGQEGITIAREARPDTILIDLAMPGMDGFEATQRLKQDPETSDIIVIACSAFNTREYQERSFQVGCEGYITKPIEPQHLLEQVMKLVVASKIRKLNGE